MIKKAELPKNSRHKEFNIRIRIYLKGGRAEGVKVREFITKVRKGEIDTDDHNLNY